MKNIEIKARFKDITKGQQIAESMGAKYVGLDHQIDTYFKVPLGRFKLRESTLSGAYLVPYLRQNDQGPKTSQYTLIPTPDVESTKYLFSQILGIDTIIEKYRHIYLYDNVRVHLDDVLHKGTFFELEAVCSENCDLEHERMKVNEMLRTFNIQSSDLLTGSYRELLRA